MKEICVGEGHWEHFHRPYTNGNINNNWQESLNKQFHGVHYGKHWREETIFIDRNYHGN